MLLEEVGVTNVLPELHQQILKHKHKQKPTPTRPTDRPTNKPNKQTNERTNKPTNKQTNKQTCKQTNKQTSMNNVANKQNKQNKYIQTCAHHAHTHLLYGSKTCCIIYPISGQETPSLPMKRCANSRSSYA